MNYTVHLPHRYNSIGYGRSSITFKNEFWINGDSVTQWFEDLGITQYEWKLENTNCVYFEFEREADAVMFALRWS